MKRIPQEQVKNYPPGSVVHTASGYLVAEETIELPANSLATAAEIRDAAPGLGWDEAAEMLELERAGKNRVSVIEALEARLEELTDGE